MAKFKSEELLKDLADDVKRIKESAEFFIGVDNSKLAYCPDKGRWSVVQVLEHLNAYNRHYLPAIEKELALVTYDTDAWFTSGYWGEKFTKMMRPSNVHEETIVKIDKKKQQVIVELPEGLLEIYQ